MGAHINALLGLLEPSFVLRECWLKILLSVMKRLGQAR